MTAQVNWWQSWGEPFVSTAAMVAAATSAWWSLKTSQALQSMERKKLTFEMITAHAALGERTWETLTPNQRLVLPFLDWSRSHRHAVMDRVISFLNSGERLAQAWRAGALDTGVLMDAEGNSGSVHLVFSQLIFPPIRSGTEQPNAFDAYENLIEAWWLRLPADRRQLEHTKLPMIENRALHLVAAMRLDMLDELKDLAPFLRTEA